MTEMYYSHSQYNNQHYCQYIATNATESSLCQRIQPLHVVHMQLVQCCMVFFLNLKRNVNNLWQCDCFFSNWFRIVQPEVTVVYEYHQKCHYKHQIADVNKKIYFYGIHTQKPKYMFLVEGPQLQF